MFYSIGKDFLRPPSSRGPIYTALLAAGAISTALAGRSNVASWTHGYRLTANETA